MPIFLLDNEPGFPDPELSTPDGLLAVGGDLCAERLLEAYSSGIFPWYSDESPILWWSPNPRMVLFPDKFKISKSLKQIINSDKFEVRFDTCFEDVIRNCADVPRKEQDGTWITDEMIEAYIEVHKAGYAHSVETFSNGKLVGGLYGISIGKAFFGESMYHSESNASKIALAALVNKAIDYGFIFIDAQQKTSHMKNMGAELIPRKKFLELLKKAINFETLRGKWD